MKKEFKTPAIETHSLAAESVMADDLAIFANSPGKSMSREGFAMTDDVTTAYNAWKGFGE